MVKPLHAGVAARNGVMAARLAQQGFTASEHGHRRPAGLPRRDGQRAAAIRISRETIADLGSRWEILDTGISVKLYPSCAATHPPLDALLAARARARIHRRRRRGDRRRGGLDDAAPADPRSAVDRARSQVQHAVLRGGGDRLRPSDDRDVCRGSDSATRASSRCIPRVTLRANTAFDAAAPLSQARVTVRLRDGRTLTRACRRRARISRAADR